MEKRKKDVDHLTHLVSKAKELNPDAFSQLYERYVSPIFRYIYIQIGHYEDAEDLTQSVFLKVWNALPRFKHQGIEMTPWLYTIARNTVIDYWRKKKAIIIDNDGEENFFEKIAGEDDVMRAGERKEMKKIIQRYLEMLSHDQREVIVFKFIEDMSNKDIARITGKSEAAVRQLQCRALKSLREKMAGVDALLEHL